MRYWLEITGSDGCTMHFPLDRADTIVGHGAECHICIPLRCVSRHHCRIEWRGGPRLTVYDLCTPGGTKVNGREVSSVGLKAGDCVEIGPVRLCVCSADSADQVPKPMRKAGEER